jgi:hypothetical protein
VQGTDAVLLGQDRGDAVEQARIVDLKSHLPQGFTLSAPTRY